MLHTGGGDVAAPQQSPQLPYRTHDLSPTLNMNQHGTAHPHCVKTLAHRAADTHNVSPTRAHPEARPGTFNNNSVCAHRTAVTGGSQQQHGPYHPPQPLPTQRH